MTRRWRRALLLPLIAVLAGLPWALDRLVAVPEPLRLSKALFAETIDDERARERALPHRWRSDCADCRTVWYRFDLALDDLPPQTQAVLVPAQADNVAVYLNGRLIGQGGRFADPVARLGPRPLLASAPAALWNPGDNRLYVLVKAGRPDHGFMPAPGLGPEAGLRRLAQWREFLALTLPQVFATAAAIVALTMGAIWFHRRRDADYGVYALAALAWAVHVLFAMLVDTPWPAPVWDAWLATTAAVAAAAAWVMGARLSDRGPRRVAALAAAAAGGAAAVAAFAEPTGVGADVVRALALAAFGLAGAQLAWRNRQRAVALSAAGAAVAAGAVHDLAVAARVLAPDAVPALPLALPVLLGVAAWLLLLRFVETLNAVELLNIDLEALVRERTAALEAQFERVRELERERAIATERERLMRDMHDGVGGHLVSMLAMIEADDRRPAELATVVRDALDDMRLMIDSLEPVDDDLNAVLAMLRDRLAPRLRAARVDLHWDVPLLPAVPGLTPARVLHVLRMLQEAVTNAIRHGGARTLWIAAAATPDAVRLVVRDDGAGFDPATVRGGRGLANLRRRAAEVDATLTIASAPAAGTTVSIVLGLRGNASAAA
ncbi:MAG: sensor histidine kinase [Betaproteobacteria bacterium]|nr:MAG: sensor histidine kinase [Betaproteobacteria bacterium]